MSSCAKCFFLALFLSTFQNPDVVDNISAPHSVVQLHPRGRTGLAANRNDPNNNRPRGRLLLPMSSWVFSFSPTCFKYSALKHFATAFSLSS